MSWQWRRRINASVRRVGMDAGEAVDCGVMRAAGAAVVLSLLSLVPLTPAVTADTIRVRADHWYPVNGDPAAPRPGFAVEILDRAWTLEGHELDYRVAPWRRSLDRAMRGQIDCVVGAYVNDAPELLFPETPLGVDKMSFYVRAHSEWRYKGPESLAGTALAVIGGYAYGEPLDSYIADPPGSARLTVMEGNHALENNIRLLLAGRVDALLESALIMDRRLEETGMAAEFRKAGSVEQRNPFYVACSPERKTSQGYLDSFDRGMERLRASGELRAIYDRYRIPEAFRSGTQEKQ